MTELLSSLSNNSNIFCCICLDENSDNNHHIFKMITQCNHYFHKSCFYRANRGKSNISCPYCKSIQHDIYTREKYNYCQLNYDSLFVIRQIQKIMKNLYIINYAISGSFAVHTHQTLHNFNPKWKYNDIDVYYNNYMYNLYIPDIMKIDNLIIMKSNNDNTDYTSYSRITSNIIDVNKLLVYVKTNKSDEEIVLKKIMSIDLIFVYNKKPYQIINNFDLDCCKISIVLLERDFKIYINNNFYIDSYKVLDIKNKDKIIKRIEKYRDRGFKCLDLDNNF